MSLQVTDVSQRNSSSGTSGSASSPSSGISSQLTGSHQQQHTSGQQNNSNSQTALATAQLLSQQLLMHGALGTQDIQAIASTLQQHQLQSLQQQLQQFAMFQASPAAGQIPPFFLQNQVRVITMFQCELRLEVLITVCRITYLLKSQIALRTVAIPSEGSKLIGVARQISDVRLYYLIRAQIRRE